MGFVHLVKRLFNFIEAVRSNDWDLYLSSFESMIKDFSSFDRIKYRRWPAVYLADMHHLKESEDVEDRKVWQAFKNGDFNCQKSNISGTAIGRDHCREQENKKIKKRGGIKGITMNENSIIIIIIHLLILLQSTVSCLTDNTVGMVSQVYNFTYRVHGIYLQFFSFDIMDSCSKVMFSLLITDDSSVG